MARTTLIGGSSRSPSFRRTMRINKLTWLLRGVLVIGVASAFAACGGTAPQRDAPVGTPLDVGGVEYDVQTARELNPDAAGDRALFAGVRAPVRALPPDQVWLGVFLQAQNESDDARSAARSIVVADSLGHTFRPVSVARDNAYAYRPAVLAPGATLPAATSVAATSPEQGSVLLFRVPLANFLSNRPLELRIGDASVQLDV